MRGKANGGEVGQQSHPPRDEEEGERDEEKQQQQQPLSEEAQRQQQQQPLSEEAQRQHGQSQRAPRPSSGQQPPPPPSVAMRNVGYVGKHRLSAAIARLDQELQSLQDELNELETMEPASAACQEVITSTEGKPDPLLPITSGPENSSWDRWFQRVRSSRSNKWWTSKGSDFS